MQNGDANGGTHATHTAVVSSVVVAYLSKCMLL